MAVIKHTHNHVEPTDTYAHLINQHGHGQEASGFGLQHKEWWRGYHRRLHEEDQETDAFMTAINPGESLGEDLQHRYDTLQERYEQMADREITLAQSVNRKSALLITISEERDRAEVEVNRLRNDLAEANQRNANQIARIRRYQSGAETMSGEIRELRKDAADILEQRDAAVRQATAKPPTVLVSPKTWKKIQKEQDQ